MPDYIFFDTETTDLPSKKIPQTHPDQARLMQLAAIRTTSEGEIIETYSQYVKIGDAKINRYAFEAHGITREKANEEGVTPMDAFFRFHSMAADCDALICHNFSFDINLILLTGAQVRPFFDPIDTIDMMLTDLSDLPYYCTMNGSKGHCALPFPSGRKGYKNPKLPELYKILFEEEYENEHDALSDVTATMKCFFKLRELEVM